MDLLRHLGDALSESGHMAWQIAWSLVLGFVLAAVIQAVVGKGTISRALPDDRPVTLLKASGFGMASSSCSYAAAALARTLFRKGASFTASMVFQIASTNLVVELGIILWLLIGWRFTLAELVGGLVMIVVVALLLRLLPAPLVVEARRQADRGLAGSMEGHAAMDMSVGGEGGLLRRLLSPAGLTSVAQIFVMEWAAVLRDLVIGLLLAGAAAAWIPDSFWRTVFAAQDPVVAQVVGPLVGPLVAVATFVCSVGNVPLAAVLWNGGISFGGVVAFLFADLLIVPILLIYRRYYGWRTTVRLVGIFYAAAVVAGYVVELAFTAVGLVPQGPRSASTGDEAITWNYTTVLNIAFLALAAVLVVRFLTTGGASMLLKMGGGPDGGHPAPDDDTQDHHSHDHRARDHHHDAGSEGGRTDQARPRGPSRP
ncbi:hypothetical protein SAMN04488544_3626 [Microlunatus sagamiharensis]|uniref:Permease n=1 Tax=Microlunatus sagamiharensis TaxID=546874 RepID=A0A1H2NAP6_9ACTN|nr:permease [Microlunatus sagamiharensis]SDV02368.1 hypothetical protein SAMN04488544_3626 [Microlunatus sagamiharensis]